MPFAKKAAPKHAPPVASDVILVGGASKEGKAAAGVVAEKAAVETKAAAEKKAEPEKKAEAEWSPEQQKALEAALARFPASLGNDRWEQIAGAVEGKTRKECVARFKSIVAAMKAQKVAAAAAPAQ
jgi:hypothetical protein